MTCPVHVAIPEVEGCPVEQFLTSGEVPLIEVDIDAVVSVILEEDSFVVLEDFFRCI